MRPLAVVLALLLLAAPVADAKPVKCTKTVSKGCRKFAGVPPRSPIGAVTPMAGIDPFAPAPAPAVPVEPSTPAPPPPPSIAPARLGVVAREWSLTLSRSALPAGAAVVELQNFGEDAHNLRIERTDGSGAPLNVPLAESGERQRAGGTLAAGDYKVYCALPGHDAQGMHARLVVTQ
ncbi:MAG: hypothetical protein QOC77_2302 [Thermoleophilaceae bacterium]|jgi:hypothetical protein|nr:hypothetical protein [Thermoleophilaceae bacterium]